MNTSFAFRADCPQCLELPLFGQFLPHRLLAILQQLLLAYLLHDNFVIKDRKT